MTTMGQTMQTLACRRGGKIWKNHIGSLAPAGSFSFDDSLQNLLLITTFEKKIAQGLREQLPRVCEMRQRLQETSRFCL